ncbi:NAD(P)-dependent oxidoreductase [Streptomyces sp. SLBN-31]|uniref:NAD(P)-dependent oxidoreductase n=1 Tax=Streptomyces sp. SLBN-31 TaxID=2768444 RepID=UPI001166EB11|nr:NAD(P)-dependent oxidoreductase [Streptomyces sp. SLBN-31]TQJ90828.1 D-3-phosphoglycerate dehydrogenase [Streptomyces sp. SLBN-31]
MASVREETAVRVLVVGDRFIPAGNYAEALAEVCGPRFGPVRRVDWPGTKAEQHAAQQTMEWHGAGAVAVPREIVGAVGNAEVLAVHFAPVPREVLQAAGRLRAVCVARAGVENVDVAAATARRVAVVPVFGRNATAVAELAIGLMLAEARDIARADASVKAGGWRKDFGGPGREIGAGTVGLIGLGHVGRAFAERMRGFGARLIAYDPYVPDDVLAHHGVARAGDLDTVFRESDVVQLFARLTAETERFIGARSFALMKPTAYFVNTARSRLVDTYALYEALANRRIAGAGLDVHDQEPLPADSPWRSLDNVTITTHYAGDTTTTALRSARLVAEVIAELATTGRCAAAVNARELGWV